MPVTYQGPQNTVTTQGPQQVIAGQSQARTIAIYATFPKGPDSAVIVSPQQMASTFGDPTATSSMGYTGPYLYWFSAQQKAPVQANTGIQYLVKRLGVTRAQYNLLDAGANTAVTLQGIGKYAGSAGTNLRVSVATSGSPTNQVWSLALSGTGLGGTYTLTLPGYGTTATINETDTAATVQTDLTNAFGAGTFTVTGTTWGATGGTYTITAAGPFAGSVLPNFTVNSANMTGTVTAFTSSMTTPGVRPTVQSISIYDNTVSTTSPIAQYKDTSQAGGTSNLNTTNSGNPNQAIVNAINGANPLNNVNSVVQAKIGTSAGAPATVTLQAMTVPTITNGAANADGLNLPYTSVTQAALQDALWAPADYIITGWDAALLAPTLINHFSDGLAQTDFRKAYVGPSAGTTYTTMSTSYVTAALQNDRLVTCGNDNFTAPHPALNVPWTWDGFYGGAIAAGLKASAPQCYTGAQWPVRGVTTVGPSTGLSQQLTSAQVNALEAQGLFVLVQPLTQGVAPIFINNMVTTAPYAAPGNSNAVNPFYQASSRDTDDSVSRNVVASSQPFLLQPALASGAVQTAMTSAIRNGFSAVASITNGLNSIQVNQDPNTLAVTPQVSYQLKFPLTSINNVTSFTTS